MTDRQKAQIEQNANSITSWLADNRAEFEEQGISEDSLSKAPGIGGIEEIRAAVDHLENHEVVVRWPQALATPPRFLLKPGRIWPETRDHLLAGRAAGGAS